MKTRDRGPRGRSRHPTSLSDSERVAIFVDRCRELFKLDVDLDVQALLIQDKLVKGGWAKLHREYLRKRVIQALAKLGIEGDASDWQWVEKHYGRLIITSAGRGRGRPRKLPPTKVLLSEFERLGKDTSGKLGRRYGVKPGTVRAELRKINARK